MVPIVTVFYSTHPNVLIIKIHRCTLNFTIDCGSLFHYQPCDWLCFVRGVRWVGRLGDCGRQRYLAAGHALDWIAGILGIGGCQVRRCLSHCLPLFGCHSPHLLGHDSRYTNERRCGKGFGLVVWRIHRPFGWAHVHVDYFEEKKGRLGSKN